MVRISAYQLISVRELVTRWYKKMAKEILDIGTVVRILKFLAERPNREASITEIVKNVHISFATCDKYIRLLLERGVIDVRTEGRKKIIKITEKGYDVLIAASRVYALLGLPFE